MAVPTVGAATSATSGATDSGTLTINKPTVATGDLLLAAMASGDPGPWTAPAGWTELYNANYNSSGNGFAIFYRVVDGSEGSSFSFTISDAAGICGGMIPISGQADTSVINTSNTSEDTGGTTAETSPSVTTTVNECLIVLVACGPSDQAAPVTQPGGTTESFDVEAASGFGDVSDSCCAMAYTSQVSAGATGTFDWTSADTAGAFQLTTIAIAPRPGGGLGLLLLGVGG